MNSAEQVKGVHLGQILELAFHQLLQSMSVVPHRFREYGPLEKFKHQFRFIDNQALERDACACGLDASVQFIALKRNIMAGVTYLDVQEIGDPEYITAPQFENVEVATLFIPKND